MIRFRLFDLSQIQQEFDIYELEISRLYISGYLTVDCDADSDPFWVEYPLLKPSSSPIDLPGNQSLDECQEVCKSQFDRCTAVDFIPNQRCRVFERAEKASYEDTSKGKLSTSMHLQICLTGTAMRIIKLNLFLVPVRYR